jgi:hypothetical protein
LYLPEVLDFIIFENYTSIRAKHYTDLFERQIGALSIEKCIRRRNGCLKKGRILD